jgi:hypothetical protein
LFIAGGEGMHTTFLASFFLQHANGNYIQKIIQTFLKKENNSGSLLYTAVCYCGTTQGVSLITHLQKGVTLKGKKKIVPTVCIK